VDVKTIEWGVVDWIQLAQDRNKWRAVVSTLMNSEIHKMLEISSLAEELSASPGGFWSMDTANCVCACGRRTDLQCLGTNQVRVLSAVFTWPASLHDSVCQSVICSIQQATFTRLVLNTKIHNLSTGRASGRYSEPEEHLHPILRDPF